MKLTERQIKSATHLMHTWSGDVATVEDWRSDFEGMDVESWFGVEADACEGRDWLDVDCFAVVEKNDDTGEWVEVY